MKFKKWARGTVAAVSVAGVSLVALSGVASADGPFGFFGDAPSPHALFVQTDAVSGNQILAYRVGSDGTISFSHSYPTGGDGATAAGATADPLASQGGLALVNHDQDLIAVNAGSDTITVFSVQGTRLSYLEQIGSGGQFPVSVSSDGNLVAVLNAGGAGSVAEFQFYGNFLQPVPGQVRSLNLSNTTPPDFHHGAGEVAYTPNGQHLVVTTKLSSNAYDVFSVSPNGTLGASPVVTTADNALPFAFVFDAAGNVVGAEASDSSVSVYQVGSNGALSLLGSVGDGGTALCWISGANGYFYGSNAGSADVSSFTESNTGEPTLVNADAATTHAGTTDSVVSQNGSVLYVESGGAGTIDVFAIGSGGSLKPIETIFNIPVGSEGLAIS